MSRTSNPYEAGEIAHPAQRDAATAWADGYRAYRNGESRTNADLAYDTWLLRAAWSEGWYASRADVRAEFDTGRPAKRAGDLHTYSYSWSAPFLLSQEEEMALAMDMSRIVLTYVPYLAAASLKHDADTWKADDEESNHD